jgi:serine/threonine-protein kinase
MPDFPTLGTELGGYRVERLIGRGGMSVVYLAEQLALGRMVALKLLSPELSEDEEFRQRFIRESRLAGGLEHPNIIPVHEAGDVEGLLFIAMRYVEGSDLKALLQREGPLSLEKTIALIGQAASALDAAHARGLVHRDVKPGNLLVASGDGPEDNEHVYLSDFGLTKKTDSKSRMTSTGQFVGTLDYVAPEQIQGKEVTGATDIYSLACVALECLTGHAPYERDSEVAVMYAHLQDPPPKPTAMRPDLPPALDLVFERAMAKDPTERYTSCRELMRAMRDAAGMQSSGPQTIPPQKPARGLRRKQSAEAKSGPRSKPSTPRTPVAAPVDSGEITQPGAVPPGGATQEKEQPKRPINMKIAALALVPILAGTAFVLTRVASKDKTQDAGNPTGTESPEGTPGGGGGGAGAASFPGQLAYLEETKPGSETFFVDVARPPDGKPVEIPGTSAKDWRNRRPDWASSGAFFAFATPDQSGKLDIKVVDPTSPRDLVDSLKAEGSQGSVAVSPDGDRLAFSQIVDSNLDIYVWNRTTGAVDRLTTNPGDDDSPEWSPDGNRLVFERETGNDVNDIYIMDADGTNLERITDTPDLNEKLPEFNPVDDTLIVYHQQEPGSHFGIYVHDTDEPMIDAGVKIIDTPAYEMRPTWSPDGKFIAFDSDAAGNINVFIIPFDGLGDPPAVSDAVQITDGPSDEQSPSWGSGG